MSRDLKRVPMDFEWPLRKTWAGFVRPDELDAIHCDACGGSGWNPAMRQLSEDWYDNDGCGTRWWYDYQTGIDGRPANGPPWKVFGQTRRWSDKLTQDEVDHLIEEGRLNGYVNRWDDQARAWVRDPSKVWPTAERINHDMQFGMGHDGINHAIMTRFRGKRLGIYGHCPVCDGETVTYRDEAHRAASEAWTETPIPTGDGYQMWETVSEGSPISPVFETEGKLALWLVRNEGGSYAAWMETIRNGYTPSFVMSNGKVRTGVDANLDGLAPAFNVIEEEPPEEYRDEEFFHLYNVNWGRHKFRNYARPSFSFEGVFPGHQTSDRAEFIQWLTERRIKHSETLTTHDTILTGSLSASQAMEFKLRWV